jgi:2-polyprenyl-3-methyl-5-hydroxy-6-metoxy-1,4-benzoquinol methylase
MKRKTDTANYSKYIAGLYKEPITSRIIANNNFIQKLKRLKIENIVDVGCGDGNFVKLLKQSGFHPLGIEPNKYLCQICKQQGLPVINQDIYNTKLSG